MTGVDHTQQVEYDRKNNKDRDVGRQKQQNSHNSLGLVPDDLGKIAWDLRNDHSYLDGVAGFRFQAVWRLPEKEVLKRCRIYFPDM